MFGELPRLPESLELKDKYSFKCASCGAGQTLKPSLMMHMGYNSGHGSCLGCKTFLHLSLDDKFETAVSEVWDSWAEWRIQNLPEAQPAAE